MTEQPEQPAKQKRDRYVHPAARQAIRDLMDAQKAENDLRNLVGLANHPGFGLLLQWLRPYQEMLTGLCCSVSTDEKDTLVARAELRVIRGILSLFEEAADKLPHAVEFLALLQAGGKWWQTFGIDIQQEQPQ